jgi:uncharacterized membrane protein YecN with MAPEG domain
MKTSLKNSVALLRAKTGQVAALAVAGVSTMVATVAHAAGESAAATQAATSVGTTQTDMLLVFAAVLTLAIAVWGIYKMIRIFNR